MRWVFDEVPRSKGLRVSPSVKTSRGHAPLRCYDRPAAPPSESRTVPLYAFTIALSAFLLFLVQPIVARQILPWFGGSAAVWTTCMMFRRGSGASTH